MEVWKTVIMNGVVYDNYEVSNFGRVRNVKTGRILKPQKHKDGYLLIGLSKNGKTKHFTVHRIVATMFIENDDIENKTEVNHKNEIKHDNRVENLEWCSPRYNHDYGTHNERVANAQRKKIIGKSLTENKVIVLRGVRQAEKFGFNHSAISKCCNGKQQSHKGYTWSYIK